MNLRPRALALLVAAWSIGGCANDPDGNSQTTRSAGSVDQRIWRAIEQDPPLLSLVDAVHEEHLASWNLDAAAISGGDGGNPPVIEVEVDRASEQIHVVVARVDNYPAGSLALWWKSATRDYSPDAVIQIQMERSQAGVGIARFDVAHHPQWRGRITGLRVYAEQRRRTQLRPRTLELLEQRFAETLLHEIAAEPWKIALDQDVRNGYLLLPGVPRSFELDFEGEAQLRFAFGLEGGVREPMELTLHLEEEGSAPRTLARFEAATPVSKPVWREERLAISARRGNRATLRFSATSAGHHHPSEGFLMISNLEIVRRDLRRDTPNVVLISVDTLRADHLSAYGYSRTTSPAIDRWAAGRAALFETVVASAPSTLPSHASILTGLDSFRHAAQHDPLPDELTTLAEKLRAAGYGTVAVTGGGYMSPALGFTQGFDLYRSWIWGFERARELPENLEWTLDWLAGAPAEPFFLLFHTYEVHPPYRARSPHFRRWNAADRDDSLLWVGAVQIESQLAYRHRYEARFEYRPSDPSAPAEGSGSLRAAIDRYDSSIAYVDESLERLLSLLARTGLERRTLVIVTSDHGESFGENGLAGHGNLQDDNLLVPLMISSPDGLGSGRRIATQVRSLDIAPTILDLAIGADLAGADGQSLRPLLSADRPQQGRVAWSYAANSNHGLAVRHPGRIRYWMDDSALASTDPRERVFDLRSDPRGLSETRLTPEALTVLRRSATQALAELGAGIRLSIRNANAGPVYVRLSADKLSPTRVKSLGSGSGEGAWRGDALELVVAGEPVQLNLQLPSSTTLHLTFAIADQRPLPGLTIPPSRMESASFHLVEGAWVEDRRKPTGLSVTTRIVGARNAARRSTGLDGDLEQDLRALGYLQ